MNLRRVLRGGLTSIIAAALIIVFAPFFGLQSNAGGPEQYGVWIGEEQFTQDHLTIKGKTGTATYDSTKRAITFDNFESKEDNLYESGSINCQLYSEISSLTLKGDAKFNYGLCDYGIYSKGNIDIDKDAEIEVTSNNYGIYSYGKNDVSVKGKLSVVVNCANFGTGIQSYWVSVEDSGVLDVTVNGCWSNAIQAQDRIAVKGTVNAEVTGELYYEFPGETSYGLYVSDTGNIVFNSGCNANVKVGGQKGVAVYSYGGIEIYSSDIYAEGVVDAIRSVGDTITLYSGVYIKNPAEGSLSGDAKYIVDADGNAATIAQIKNVDWYDVWVGKTQVNSDNKNDIPGIYGGGSASYDPIDKVLTFKGNVTDVKGSYNDSLIYAADNLTIKGDVSFIADNVDKAIGFSGSGNLTIDGTLNLKGYLFGIETTGGATLIINGKVVADAYNGYGISCDNLRINPGAEVEAYTDTTGSSAVYADDSIVIDGGKLTAEAEKESVSAVYTNYGIMVEDGTLTAVAEGKNAIAIYGGITVNSGIVTANSKMISSEAIMGDVTINGGQLSATSEGKNTCAIEGSVYANAGIIDAEVKKNDNKEDYVINGGVTIYSGELNVKGTCSGIYGNAIGVNGGTVDISADGRYGVKSSDIRFASGNVNVEGAEYGAYSPIKIYVFGGRVTASGSKNAMYVEKKDGISIATDAAITVPSGGKVYSTTSPDSTTITYSDETVIAKTVTIEGVEKYPVYVGEKQINSDNKDDIPGIKGGTAKYDPDTNTLTFEGNVTGVTGYFSDALIYSERPLTIKGNAILSDTTVDNSICIDSSGTLIIEGNIEADSQISTVVTYGSVIISGTLKANSMSEFAISAQDNIKVTGTLEAYSSGSWNYPVYSDNGSVIFEGDSVKIKNAEAYGIYANKDVIFKSGTTEIQGKDKAVYTTSGKISIADSLAITKPSGGRLSDDSTKILNPDLSEATLVKIGPAPVYKATFDANGFGTAPEEQSVYEGKRVAKPDDITAECHVFDGWFTDIACTAAYDFDTPVTADITLYAGWTEKHKLNKIYKYPTCTEPGYEDPYYECKDCGKWFKDEDGLILIVDHNAGLLPATGHLIDPDDATYEWSEDGHTCTAKAFCIKCGEAKEVATYVPGDASSKITATVKVPATTEKMGITTYTATFETEGFAVQTKDVEDIPVIIPGSDPTPTPGGEATPGGESTPTPGGEATPGGESTPAPGGEATPAPEGGATPTPTPTAAPVEYKEDEIVKDEETNASYKISSTTSKTVVFYSFVNKNVTDFEIPAEVTLGGKKYKVTEIAPNAFKNNKKLKKFTIGKNIKKIGKNAFYGCKNLKSITVKTTKLTKKSVGKNAFKKIHKKAKIKVPKKKLKAYKKIFKARGVTGKKQKITK